jgi:hypothetical protein
MLMLAPNNPKPLVTTSDLEWLDVDPVPEIINDKFAAYKPSTTVAMRSVATWVKGFLDCPHPHLGRPKKVCPFVRGSMEKEVMYLTAIEGSTTPAEAKEAVAKFVDVFAALQPIDRTEGKLVTILILFPTVTPEEAPSVIDALQAELKPQFVDQGYMIGQFHPNCHEPGVRNPAFRPLRAPIPMLVIRNMIPEDLEFLHDSQRCWENYCRRIPAAEVPMRLLEKYTNPGWAAVK